MATNRRIAERHPTIGLISSIWDGRSTCIGVIEDVSSTGIRISQIPNHFADQAAKCFSIVHGLYGDYKVSLHPCWSKNTNRGMYKMIGFRIDNPANSWRDFVEDDENPSNLFNRQFGEKNNVTV